MAFFWWRNLRGTNWNHPKLHAVEYTEKKEKHLQTHHFLGFHVTGSFGGCYLQQTFTIWAEGHQTARRVTPLMFPNVRVV